MSTTQKQSWSTIIALLGLLLGALTYVLMVSARAGAVEARVVVLERTAGTSISRQEFDQFTQDMRDRLDRIERKLDDKNAK